MRIILYLQLNWVTCGVSVVIGGSEKKRCETKNATVALIAIHLENEEDGERRHHK